MPIDKSWMQLSRSDPKYDQGVAEFLDYAYSHDKWVEDDMIICPCKVCGLNRDRLVRSEVHWHLLRYGIKPHYTFWNLHGEGDDDNNDESEDNSSSETDREVKHKYQPRTNSRVALSSSDRAKLEQSWVDHKKRPRNEETHASEDLNTYFLDCRHTTEASLSAFESAFESSDNWVDSAEQFKSLNKLKNVVKEAGLEGIVSVPVVHCPQAFGAVVKAAERRNIIGETVPGWNLAYSGDKRPCQQLINAAGGATYLSKIPVFDDTHIMHKTCIAFDLMSINIADLPLLPKQELIAYSKSLAMLFFGSLFYINMGSITNELELILI
ncbi:hypothetical protein LguiA_003134 [Lonicera macranthoides]